MVVIRRYGETIVHYILDKRKFPSTISNESEPFCQSEAKNKGRTRCEGRCAVGLKIEEGL